MRRLAAILILSACSPERDFGLSSALRFEGATFVAEPPPAPSGGPQVASFDTSRNVIRPGDWGHPFRGTLGSSAEAALLSASDGYWIVVAGPPDAFTPDLRVIDARAELSFDAPPGDLEVEARAVDAEGRVGEPRGLTLEVVEEPIDAAPLSFMLEWEGDADLDLRVIDASGVEIYVRDPSAWQAPLPGEPTPPVSAQDSARLDVDAQAGCTRSLPRREQIRWPQPPAPGSYRAKVDTFSMCGASVAYWTVTVKRFGAIVDSVQGVSIPSDTRFSHDRGGGLLALELNVP